MGGCAGMSSGTVAKHDKYCANAASTVASFGVLSHWFEPSASLRFALVLSQGLLLQPAGIICLSLLGAMHTQTEKSSARYYLLQCLSWRHCFLDSVYAPNHVVKLIFFLS